MDVDWNADPVLETACEEVVAAACDPKELNTQTFINKSANIQSKIRNFLIKILLIFNQKSIKIQSKFWKHLVKNKKHSIKNSKLFNENLQTFIQKTENIQLKSTNIQSKSTDIQ